MSLLLVLYLAPVLAVVLFWRARRRLPDPAVWRTLVSACEGRISLLRSTAGAVVFATAIVAVGAGASGALAFVLGAAVVVLSAALAAASAAAFGEGETGADTWDGGAAVAQALSAVTVGCVGALAWFFADPAGAIVLAAFAAGASSAGLFLAMSLRTRDAQEGRTTSGDAGAPIESYLAAVAAVMMLAATAEPDALLPLGGLLAETETLRSELLLLPVAMTVVSPLVALVALPAAAVLAGRLLPPALPALERSTALLAALAMLLLVASSGLAWVVVAAFAVGLVARQGAAVAEQVSERSRFRSRRDSPVLASSLLAAAALVCGERLAGGYGAALTALGMTASFASASAAAAMRAIASGDPAAGRRGPDITEATATVATTLALLAAAAPVLVAESAQRGVALTFVVTAAPALLAGVLAGSACAAAVASRLAGAEDDAQAVAGASRAVVIAAGLPVAVGVVLGAGAAVGVALGFLAWSAASTPDPAPGGDAARLPRSVLLAWGRTMAISALIAVPVTA